MTALKKARAAQLKYIQHQPLKKHISSATRYIYTNEDWSLNPRKPNCTVARIRAI